MDTDTRMFLRLGAVALVGIAAVVAAVEVGGKDPPVANPYRPMGTYRSDEQPEDPLGPILTRCVELGEAAIRDAGCRKTWMENRRRFLGTGPHIQAKPQQPQGAAGAPLPGTSKTGVADEDFPAGTDEKALTPEANKNNDILPNDAGKDAAKPDVRPDGDLLTKPLADDQTESK